MYLIVENILIGSSSLSMTICINSSVLSQTISQGILVGKHWEILILFTIKFFKRCLIYLYLTLSTS